MTPSDKLIAFVAAWEGCRLEAYLDVGGVPTIGYGRTYNVQLGDKCTQAEADAWLYTTLRSYGRSLESYMTRTPSQQQFDALLSLGYNVGIAALGVSTTMRRFNDGADEECADRFLLWNKVDGRVVPGLSRRRAAERIIFLDGDYRMRP